MKTTETLHIITLADKRRIYIKRPCKQLAGISSYLKAFQAEAEMGKRWNHPNILKYVDYGKDDEGVYIAMEYVPNLSLKKAVVDESMHINTEVEAGKIMMQILDAVEYLHQNQTLHLNIRPENILITRKAHDVKLIQPATTYFIQKPSFFIIKEKFTAPELFDEQTEPQATADIYSLGKVMEYLFSFSNLSAGIENIIRKATHPNPAKRYSDIASMKKDLAKTPYINIGIGALKAAIVLGLLLSVYYGFKDEPTSEENIEFAQEAAMSHKDNEEINSGNISLESYYVIPTPIDSVNYTSGNRAELDKQSKEMQETAERIFKKELKKRAEKVIANIYTPQNMSLEDTEFQQQSLTGFNQLDKIQRELAEEYHLDPILSARLSSEVISELTQEHMKKLTDNNDKR